MKKIASKNQSLSNGRQTLSLSRGFSTVELLITLFVASVFLFSGYQLYSMIIKDGGETRAQARASNAAYGYLQEYKAKVNGDCDESEAVESYDDTPTITGLSNVNLTISKSCPYNEVPAITKIEVILKYGNDKSVTQATYVNAE